ncbi:MAG TPA: glucosamine-6-phosphate deaminase, partial [Pirellulaceae bacterium]|nr:glucosamine-6-phosphate deaminase [Pirellulaceae bacterium]
MSATPTPKARRVPGTKLPCFVFDSPTELARHVARMLAAIIRERNELGQNAVLGLPTGSTPTGMYRELVRLHREEGLDFSHVVTFNLDEYFGLDADQIQSFNRWMHEQFFKHVNVRPENIHIPQGHIPREKVAEHCSAYEQQIAMAGGLDVVVLGIGRNGHIGFNEPFSPRNSRTRLCTLDPVTRRAAASDFFHQDNVPTHAITMGLGTILSARKVLLLALGEHKAGIIKQTVEGTVTDRVPASFLQDHGDATVLVDAAAAQDLTACVTPWLVGQVEWTDALIKRAVLSVCQKTGKACLKLTDDDFREHNLHELLRDHGPAERLAQRVFGWMLDTVNYHPAGKEPKRVICFSPHPDDDVISMGGTLIRLNQDGHEVHVAYMTSGNIAVFDQDAHRVADFVNEYNRIFGIETEKSNRLEHEVKDSFLRKQPGQPDIDAVLKIKGLIRWSEAKYGAYVAGCKEEHLHFLDLPFYRTGTIAKRPIGPEDVAIIRELIETVRPEQIYVAGDLSDPHGTHRVCAEAIFRALKEIEAATGAIPEVLLYRGAWQEYELHEIEIAVPLSPSDIRR